MSRRRPADASRSVIGLGIVALALCAGTLRATPPSDVETVLARVEARLVEYYRRAQRLVCDETSTVQPIESNWSPQGLPRTVESELHLELAAGDGDALPHASIVRNVRRINGRPPKERDKTSRAGCTDPNPMSPEPLAFLLPAHRDEYRFTSIKEAREQDRRAYVIDFTTVVPKGRPELFGHAGGHDDCFDWTGPIAAKGRVWIDADSYDVLRVERHISGPTSIRVPWSLQRSHGLENWVVLDRDDLTLSYKPVSFDDPDETILLPSSMIEMTVMRGGLQSARRTDTYSGYRRFLTNGRVIK